MKAICVESISKKFVLWHNGPRSLVEGVRSLLFRGRREDFWALSDVSFDVSQGEALGIIGHNGAGKSTVLKILTGIMKPTSGRVRTRGRVSALIEVGAGFHPEMTGRENIYLNGTILGMTKAEIDRKLDAIICFAEMEAFIDTPVKRYSSGMFARLGFSVAAHVEPQALLVDEVLAVGDLAFQQKCFRHMQGLVDRGCAVILVTHSMYSAKQMCRRLVWIHEGRVRMDGDADTVALEYQKWANSRSTIGMEVGAGGVRWGAGGARIRSVEVDATRSEHGPGFDVLVRARIDAERRIDDPLLWIMVCNGEGQRIAGVTTRRQPGFLPVLEGTQDVSCALRSVPLMPGLHRVNVGVFDRTLLPIDRWGDAATFVIDSQENMNGLITPDFDGWVFADSEWQATPCVAGEARGVED